MGRRNGVRLGGSAGVEDTAGKGRREGKEGERKKEEVGSWRRKGEREGGREGRRDGEGEKLLSGRCKSLRLRRQAVLRGVPECSHVCVRRAAWSYLPTPTLAHLFVQHRSPLRVTHFLLFSWPLHPQAVFS